MSTKPQFTKNKDMTEWSLDDHYREDIKSIVATIQEVRSDWVSGEVSLRTLNRLAWVQDWTATVQKAMIDSMKEEV